MEFKVWSVKCVVESGNSKVWGVQCKVESVKCGV